MSRGNRCGRRRKKAGATTTPSASRALKGEGSRQPSRKAFVPGGVIRRECTKVTGKGLVGQVSLLVSGPS